MAAAKPTLARGVILPALLATAAAGILFTILSSFLGDARAIVTGLALGWAAFVAGRVLAHVDRPRGRGIFLRHVLTGVAIGFLGWTLLQALFVEGPGWPWTPWWVLLGGFGLGLYRSHRALLKQARETEAARRWIGLFHPKDLEALTVLALGYALVGLSGFLVFWAFSPIIPGAGKLLTIGLAVYALQATRLLLRFASEERASLGGGFVGWLRANLLQNTIAVLLLVGYAVFRAPLSRSVPFYPLVEFGLGIAVFGFVLGRLRARMRREGSTLATASEARDHVRVVTELRESEYDEVARPLTRFIEAGLGQAEYAASLTASLPPDDPRRERILEPLRAHREPPRAPPLELPWSLAAGGTMALGLALAAGTLGARVFGAEFPFPVYLGLLLLAFGIYAQQDAARAHFRPRLATAIAAGGTALILLDFGLFLWSVGALAQAPAYVWGIAGVVVLVMVGIPALVGWRLEKRLRAGLAADARHVSPALEMQSALQAARKRAATMMLTGFALLLPVPWFAGWLAGRGFIPTGFPEFLGDILATALWGVAAFGGSALVRFYGLTRARPVLLAREREKRERRLAVHQTLMRSIERM